MERSDGAAEGNGGVDEAASVAPRLLDSSTPRLACRGIRGATTVETNTAEDILEATTELLTALIRLNGLEADEVASAIFTTTPDLTATFPAVAARELGWAEGTLVCAHEMAEPGGLGGVVRILLHFSNERAGAALRDFNVKGEAAIRPGWAVAEAELAALV